MSDIVLCTLNARYWHSSFGLRYLLANMGSLRERTALLEFGIKDNTIELLGRILEHRPRIIGIGVYIWNLEPVTRLVAELKQVAPDVCVVLGGPEVSHDADSLPVVQDADFVIAGEADLEFVKLCEQVLTGLRPAEKMLRAPLPQMDELRLPYDLYSDEDIAHRVIYVEVSRGCPFSCEFCLSALDIPVRLVDTDAFLAEMQSLLDRGARQFKFVDRTFNLNIRVGTAILQFFLDRYQPGMFLHFEMIPDRLPIELKEIIARFPDGALQFEIGVQTFNDDVGDRISRKQDNAKLAENFQFLRGQTGVHIHADLIVGLPGESIESFERGFDRLVELRPQEIQVGMLKRLRGTPITRHDDAWQMVYSPHPPYEILSTSAINFEQMQRMRRFARFWDLVGNSGNFRDSLPLLLGDRPFHNFMRFCDWLFDREQKQHGISLTRLTERVFEFVCQQGTASDEIVAAKIWSDYVGGGRYDKPRFLNGFILPEAPRRSTSRVSPPRQARHQ